jgi:tryptophan-rich sensory protein
MYHFRSSYVVVPLVTLFVAALGSAITGSGMRWYQTINLPSWTPSGQVIGAVWSVIFILTALSALLVWNHFPRDRRFAWVVIFFVLNAVLNVAWSYIFFSLHNIATAVDEAVFLCFSVIVLMVIIWPGSRFAASLLIPYVLWSAFAAYLTAAVWWLNG